MSRGDIEISKNSKMLISLTNWFYWTWGRGYEHFRESAAEEAVRYSRDKSFLRKYLSNDEDPKETT